MIEVLLVDDHLEPMKALARLVGLRTNLTYEVTDSLDRALAIVKSGGVKVAVLDQRLQPTLPMDGTKVFAEIRKIDHRVRGIIISGQSDKADLVELNALGMAYLDRGCSAEDLAQERSRTSASCTWRRPSANTNGTPDSSAGTSGAAWRSSRPPARSSNCSA